MMSHHHHELFFPEQIEAGKYHYILYFHDRTNGRRVVTIYPSAWEGDDHHIATFYFEDGNGGCDCNRSLWMYNYEMPNPTAPGVTLSGEENDSYSCRDDHPIYPDNKIIIERVICLETGATVAVNI